MAFTRGAGAGNPAAESGEKAAKPAVDPAAIQAQIERVFSDPLFHNSKRNSKLLKFIVDKSLDGHHECLKERIIGIEVFGRAPDYETSTDPSVRVAAAELRRRLSLYYMDPAHEGELRIDLPSRSYVAEFRVPEPKVQHVQEPGPRRRVISWQFGIPVAAIVAVAIWYTTRLFTPAPAIDRFWAPVLDQSGPVSVCVGSAPVLKAGTVAPAPALLGTPGPANPEMSYMDLLENQPAIPFTDVSAAGDVASFLGRKGKESSVVFAQNTTLSDLKRGPIIYLGGIRIDWVVRLGANLRFRIKQLSPFGLNYIEDANNPGSRNWAVDLSAPNEQVSKDYAVVTRDLDPSTGQWWIGVAGISGVSTLAAQQLLTDPQAMAEIAHNLPRGWDRKNLQMVLEFRLVKGSPGVPRLVASNSW